MQNLPAATTNLQMTTKDAKSENGLQRLFEKGEIIYNYRPNDDQNARRKLTRFRANGIVMMTSFGKLVVTNIYDIAPGGVSFLSASDRDVEKSQFNMDILIFDGLSDFEYFIDQVKGRVTSKQLFSLPRINEPIWRFGVEFYDLDCSHRKMLKKFCSQAFDRCSVSRLPFTKNII
jgi:hypothetical protein